MTASEFAFLALGLILGLGSGAALIEVLRARPPAGRGVKVTVAPNAIQSRASTLADPLGLVEPAGPARGGPGDRRWREDAAPSGTALVGRRADDHDAAPAAGPLTGRSGTPVRDERPAGASVAQRAAPPARPAQGAGPGPATSTGPARADPLWLSAGATSAANLVAVPMSMEPDPIPTALRSTAAAAAVAAMARADAAAPTAGAAAGAARAVAGSTVAQADDDRGLAGTDPAPTGPAPSDPAPSDPATGPDDPAATSAATAAPVADGPCADERRVADERCAVANRAREGAAAAAETLRRAQRSYDDLVARAEAATALADPRSVRTAKEAAQQRFRDARTGARTQDDVEAGARAWLAEINRINHDTREASLGIERDRAAAAAMSASLERLAVEADAARISAERADEACVAAREAVAACDEATALEAAAKRNAEAASAPDAAEGSDELAAAAAADGAAPAAEPVSRRIAAATPPPEDEFAFSTPMHSGAGEDALIIRILRGDRDAMGRAVARLAGDDPDSRRRWQTQLGGLVEALVARSIEASAFDFPVDHFFWGPFSQAQNRDIAAGLSSLGFRFDGFGGWADERVPSQRDLSLAVGYAGLDPMRIRRWPTEAETQELLRDVRVAADEYIAGAAGGLTLGELLTLLGRRADGLAELWNQWGSVRPVLLEAG